MKFLLFLYIVPIHFAVENESYEVVKYITIDNTKLYTNVNFKAVLYFFFFFLI